MIKHPIRNQQVGGSTPLNGTSHARFSASGYKLLGIYLLLGYISGCTTTQPFDYGKPVDPPEGCKEYTMRGGICSVQRALDEVHARFHYTPDRVTHPELANVINGYKVDYWELLPADGRGDCEDFALTLRWLLNARGIHGTHLLNIEVDSVGHAALELNGWIMDNGHTYPFTRKDVPGWMFISAGDESGIWREIR